MGRIRYLCILLLLIGVYINNINRTPDSELNKLHTVKEEKEE